MQAFTSYVGPTIYELNRSNLKLTPVQLKHHHVTSRSTAIIVFVERGLYAVTLSLCELGMSSTLLNIIGAGSQVRMLWPEAMC